MRKGTENGINFDKRKFKLKHFVILNLLVFSQVKKHPLS